MSNEITNPVVNDKLTARINNILNMSNGESHTLDFKGIFHKTSAKANFDGGELPISVIAGNGESSNVSLTTLKFDAIRLTPYAEAIAQRIAKAKLGVTDEEFNAAMMVQIDWEAIRSEQGGTTIKKAQFSRADRKFARSVVSALAKHMKSDSIVWGKIGEKAATRVVNMVNIPTVTECNASLDTQYKADTLAQKDYLRAVKPAATPKPKKVLTPEEVAAKDAKRLDESIAALKSLAGNMSAEKRAELLAALSV